MNMQLWFAKQFFDGVRADFYEDLAEALEDGAGLADVIKTHADRTKKAGDMTAPIFRLWFRRMDDRSFSQALLGTVPDSDVMVLEAAEAAGNLPNGLRFLSKVISEMSEMRSALWSAVIGFVFLTGLLGILLVLYSFYGVPIIEEVVPPKDWPWIGQVLRDIAKFITHFWAWILSVTVAVSVLYLWSLPNWRGRTRVAFDRYVPLYSVYRDFNGAIFLASMAQLMLNGLSLTESLEKLRERASSWLGWHIGKVLMRLDYEAEQAGLAFDTGLFSRRLTWRLIDFGARSNGKFELALSKVAIKGIDQVTKDVIASASKLNKMLMLVNALMLGFMIAGTMLTVWEANNSIQRQVNSATSTK